MRNEEGNFLKVEGTRSAGAESSGGLGPDDAFAMFAALCESKAEEFRLLGYGQVTAAEIWECVSDKYQKRGMPPLHQVVNDIFSLKVTQFMNWITMNIYKGNRM
jgi:hypothetical protein